MRPHQRLPSEGIYSLCCHVAPSATRPKIMCSLLLATEILRRCGTEPALLKGEDIPQPSSSRDSKHKILSTPRYAHLRPTC